MNELLLYRYCYILESNTNIMSISCRFCLETDSVNQMVCPCNCRGTGAFVHKACLLQWLQYTDTCNVCQSTYRLWPTCMPTVAKLIEILISHFNDILFDMTTLIVFAITYCTFIFIVLTRLHITTDDEGMGARVPNQLMNQLLTYGTLCLGVLVLITSSESFVKKCHKFSLMY